MFMKSSQLKKQQKDSVSQLMQLKMRGSKLMVLALIYDGETQPKGKVREYEWGGESTHTPKSSNRGKSLYNPRSGFKWEYTAEGNHKS